MTGKTQEQYEAEKYLMELRTYAYQMRAIEEEIRQLRVVAADVGAVNYDREHVDGGSKEEKLVLFISDIMDFQVIREQLNVESEKMKEESYKIIRQIKDTAERIFLEAYYINANTMSETISLMYVSRRSAYYIKNNALQHFGELLKQLKK